MCCVLRLFVWFFACFPAAGIRAALAEMASLGLFGYLFDCLRSFVSLFVCVCLLYVCLLLCLRVCVCLFACLSVSLLAGSLFMCFLWLKASFAEPLCVCVSCVVCLLAFLLVCLWVCLFVWSVGWLVRSTRVARCMHSRILSNICVGEGCDSLWLVSKQANKESDKHIHVISENLNQHTSKQAV